MFDQLTYKTRASAELVMKAFLRALPSEAQKSLDYEKAELVAKSDDAFLLKLGRPYRERPVDASYVALAGALRGGITAATLCEWLTGRHRITRKLEDLQRIAPQASLLLDPWGSMGPAARFFMALDAAASNQVHWDVEQSDAEKLGHLLASEVTRSVWHEWQPWAMTALVVGRRLPPGSYIGRRPVDELIEAAQNEERAVGLVGLSQPPLEGEMATPQGSILWLLHWLIWLSRHFPDHSIPPEIGLDLAAMSLVGKVAREDYAHMQDYEYPKAQLAALLLYGVFFPLGDGYAPPIAAEVESRLMHLGIVITAADAAAMANAIIGARQSVIQWLRECKIAAHEVDALLSDAANRADGLRSRVNEPPPRVRRS
jgi:hypothetical protein